MAIVQSRYNGLAMAQTVTLNPGDGIGPEVSASVVRILKAACAQIECDRVDTLCRDIESGRHPDPRA